MTGAERLILSEMSDEWVFPFAALAEKTSLPRSRVRSIVRNFKARGLVHFGPIFDEDEPIVRGSGYSLTELGLREQDKIREDQD